MIRWLDIIWGAVGIIFSSDMIRFEFLVYPCGCSVENGLEVGKNRSRRSESRLSGVQVGEHSTQCGLKSKASFSQLQPSLGCLPYSWAAGLIVFH